MIQERKKKNFSYACVDAPYFERILMSRLVTFGCSMTYGHGLEDCIGEDMISPGPTPSNYAWPVILGNKLHRSVVNLGEPGASNKKILFNIIDTNIKEDDEVVILWTFPHRDLIVNKDLGYTLIIPKEQTDLLSSEDADWERFYKVHNDYDLYISTLLCVHHAHYYLLSKGVNPVHFYFDSSMTPYQVWIHPLIMNLKKIEMSFVDINSSVLAPDKKHPSSKTHANMANTIYTYIKEKNDRKN